MNAFAALSHHLGVSASTPDEALTQIAEAMRKNSTDLDAAAPARRAPGRGSSSLHDDVDRGGGLVHEDEIRVAGEGERDEGPLLHPPESWNGKAVSRSGAIPTMVRRSAACARASCLPRVEDYGYG